MKAEAADCGLASGLVDAHWGGARQSYSGARVRLLRALRVRIGRP